MEIKFMWKTKPPPSSNCPALSTRPPAATSCRARCSTRQTRAQLRQLGGDEDAVFVPANVIDRIKDL